MQRQVRLLLEFLGIALAQLDEVLASAEGAGTGAGDDCDAEGGFAVEPVEDAVEVPVLWGVRWEGTGRGKGKGEGMCGLAGRLKAAYDGERDRVHLLGTIYGNEEDVWSWKGEEDGFVWWRDGEGGFGCGGIGGHGYKIAS